jgi:hypothetical protein
MKKKLVKKKLVKKKQRVLKIKPWISAYLEDGKGGRIVVSVPLLIEAVPEVPVVVIFEKKAYVKTNSSPLTYVNVLGGRAKRI